MEARSAAGQAAGYHFQLQRALLSMIAGPEGSSVAIETLDDLVVDGGGNDSRDFEQLKHSIHAGSLTDRSRPWWRALDAWMDLVDRDELGKVTNLVLVATDNAAEGSAAALLRAEGRDVGQAQRNLLAAAAANPGAADTRNARERFRALDARGRSVLLSKIEVRDGTAGIGDFRDELRSALGPFALPAAGIDEFLDKLVGWWERRAVDLLLRRRATVERDDIIEEVVRLRDQYGAGSLPAPDPALDQSLSDMLLKAYAGAPFVRQLELIAMRDERVQLAVRDYHRAYAQRARWLEQGVLGPAELQEWEDRLFDEWEHAWHRILDELSTTSNETERVSAGRRLYGDFEQSSLNPLRDSRDRFLHVGTLNGMADSRRIGWHPDFATRLEMIVGAVVAGSSSDAAFRDAQDAL